MSTLYYFGLEPVQSRYTYDLCGSWMPEAFHQFMPKDRELVVVQGEQTETDIKVGCVLDATGRGIYSLTQCQAFLQQIRSGLVSSADVLYFQDFWTPGMEAIFYALDLYGIKPLIFSMCHAQSVDEFDFTHNMLPWIRHFELGVAERMTGIFVASSIHRDQMRKAGMKCPIHVVSLPFAPHTVLKGYPTVILPTGSRTRTVMYTSRLDAEKDPHFMLDVAEEFLRANPSWAWEITTSADKFRSNDPSVLDRMHAMAVATPNLKLYAKLSKQAYYEHLSAAAIQFNSAKQDYVSWTLLEAALHGAEIVYPRFRSFPECVPPDRLYAPGNVADACRVLRAAALEPRNHVSIAMRADLGRRIVGFLVARGIDSHDDINVWTKDTFDAWRVIVDH